MRVPTSSLTTHLRKHRAITRLALAGLALSVALGVSQQGAAAGNARPSPSPLSILPENVGAGVLTTDPVTITFSQAMDAAAVEAGLRLEPAAAYGTTWNAAHTSVSLTPRERWQTDQRYVVTVPGFGPNVVGRPTFGARQVTFTTQTAPVVSDFRVHLVEPTTVDARQSTSDLTRNIPFGAESTLLGDAPFIDAPEDTADDASANTGIHIGFSTAMNQADVEARFHIEPQVRGSFSWTADQLTFAPTDRLKPGKRYAVSVVGAHDMQGNRLAGDVAFSFTTRSDADLVSVTPDRHATNVMARQVVIRFSEPMNAGRTRHALRVRDVTSGHQLGGSYAWNARHTRLEYHFSTALPRGHTIEVRLARGARDLDGNRLSVSWRFRTKAPKHVRADAVPTQNSTQAPTSVGAVRSGPNAPADALSYALWLINQSRARYGFGPMRLDAAVAKIAAGHAWDEMNYGYFSHTGRDGSTVSDRLRAAGIGFSWSGENMCYYNGMSLRATLDWCHNTFMSEPYPGFANHIGNILSGHYSRVGIGIAQSGGKVIIVWDFAG